MARPRKTASKAATAPAASKAATPAAPVPAAPAPAANPNPFGAAPAAPAPVTPPPAPPAPAVQQGQSGNPFGGAPAPNPAVNMFAAAQAAHPTSNPAVVVDLSEVNAKLDNIAKVVAEFGEGFKSVLQAISILEGKLSALAVPQSSPAPTPTAPAQPSAPTAPVAAAPEAPAASGFDPAQVAHVVTYIRQTLAGHYATGGAPINVNEASHTVMLVNAAIGSGAPYLQGADPNNQDLRAHVVTALQQAGAVDASGNVTA